MPTHKPTRKRRRVFQRHEHDKPVISPFQRATELAYYAPLKFMPTKKQHILGLARALFLLLTLFSGWVAVPVSLGVPQAVECGMECCEEAGVCYCNNPHPEIPASAVQISRISRGCAARCITVAAITIKFSAAPPALPPVLIAPDGTASLPEPTAPRVPALLLSGECAPRAPPRQVSL